MDGHDYIESPCLKKDKKKRGTFLINIQISKSRAGGSLDQPAFPVSAPYKITIVCAYEMGEPSSSVSLHPGAHTSSQVTNPLPPEKNWTWGMGRGADQGTTLSCDIQTFGNPS